LKTIWRLWLWGKGAATKQRGLDLNPLFEDLDGTADVDITEIIEPYYELGAPQYDLK
jgi:hypothetical protein